MAVVDEVADAVLQRELLWTTVSNGDAVYSERALQVCQLEEFVAHYIGIGFTLDVNNDAHTLTVRLVIYIADAINLLFVYQCCNLLDQLRLIDVIRNFAYNNLVVCSL